MKAEVYMVFVFDRSGSMFVIRDEAIANYNNFLDEQKKLPQKAHFRLVLFNTVVETKYVGDLAQAPHLDRDSYVTDGWTALYDAMADAIHETGGELAALPEHERPAKVIVATMTDGQENRSVRFAGEAGRKKLSEMIRHQQEKYNWEFIFLGANIDAKQTALDLNIPIANAIQWDSDAQGAQIAFAENSRTFTQMRTSVGSKTTR